jgi:hypothetical protein
MEDFNDRHQALKLQLASQYGVHPSLITLQATPGSLQLTVTIATTNGADARIGIATLRDQVNAVDMTALTTSIRQAMNASVNITSYASLADTTVAVTREIACERGQWHVVAELEPMTAANESLGCSLSLNLVHRCTAGRVYNCTIGFYNPFDGQIDAAACIRCPTNSNTLFEKRASISDCLCDEGYYDANASHAAVECVACPVGTECSRGSTLDALPLRKGYYRLDPASVDVRVCPDAQINCSSSFGTFECESTSGCQGGTGFPCANNLTGVYCRLCDRSDDTTSVFFKSATAGEVATCEVCGDKAVETAILVLAVLAAAALALITVLLIGRRLSPKIIARLTRIFTPHTPDNKIKIIVVFTRLPRGFRASMR